MDLGNALSALLDASSRRNSEPGDGEYEYSDDEGMGGSSGEFEPSYQLHPRARTWWCYAS